MDKKIKFSVLMPVYCKENPIFFKQALNSIMQQTLMPNEIVIVKDGPLTIELNKIINEYTLNFNNLFNIVTLEKNVGQGKARNAGIKACKYNYIALMDSDDIACPTRFEKQITYLQEHLKLLLYLHSVALSQRKTVLNDIYSIHFHTFH